MEAQGQPRAVHPLQTPGITQGTIPRGTQELCPGGVTTFPPRLATMGSVGAERFKELSPVGTPEGNVVMSFSFDSYQLEEDELQRGSQAKGILTFMEPGEGRHGPDPQPGAGFPAGFPPI